VDRTEFCMRGSKARRLARHHPTSPEVPLHSRLIPLNTIWAESRPASNFTGASGTLCWLSHHRALLSTADYLIQQGFCKGVSSREQTSTIDSKSNLLRSLTTLYGASDHQSGQLVALHFLFLFLDNIFQSFGRAVPWHLFCNTVTKMSFFCII